MICVWTEAKCDIFPRISIDLKSKVYKSFDFRWLFFGIQVTWNYQ